MRILITSNSGAGHLGPLFPFARALVRAGDDVVLAAPAKTREMVEAAGVPFRALANPPEAAVEAVTATFPGLTNEAQGVRMMGDVFAGIHVRSSLPGIVRAIRDLRPDIVLREPTEFAGLLAAERVGLPHGRLAIMAAATETWGLPIVAPVLDTHRRRLRLQPDPRAARLAAAPYLTVIPEAMEDPADPAPAHALRFREPQSAPEPLPATWWRADDRRPLVYATYGSVMPGLPGFRELFEATAAALGALPVRALFTVGNEIDLASLPPVPANVRLERWVPQHAVMPHTAAMIGHGGAGTTRMALAAGVPSVNVPGIADQFRNAQRVAELGAGIALAGAAEAPGRLLGALCALLEDPSYAAAAQRVAREVAALPLIDDASAALREQLRPARAA
jgi:UDP:flavonoid glycosyltransferase YjiC (YdhE family)